MGLSGGANIPLGQLATGSATCPDATIVVACHVGGRSSAVAKALSEAGWTAENLTGGAVAWAAGDPGQEPGAGTPVGRAGGDRTHYQGL